MDVAFAAASQDGEPAGLALFALAREMGASLDSCAAAFAVCGAHSLLAASLGLGANPNACESLAHRTGREPRGIGEEPTTLARRAYFSGSVKCSALLAAAGVDPLKSAKLDERGTLVDGHCLAPFGVLVSPDQGGAGGGSWTAFEALFGSSAACMEKATAMAKRHILQAISSIRSGAAAEPLSAMRRLRELGANFEALRPSERGLAQEIWTQASLAIVRRSGSDPLKMTQALRLTANFVQEVDPAGASRGFAQTLASASRRIGGLGSSLPETAMGVAIKEIALDFAAACEAESSAAEGLLMHASPFGALMGSKGAVGSLGIPEDWIRGGAPSLDLRGAARDVKWMIEQAREGAWAKPSRESLGRLHGMIAGALCCSAMLFARAAEDGSAGEGAPAGHGERWLATALSVDSCEPIYATSRAADLPLGCVKAAAASDPRLAKAILAAAPTAARLARPGLSMGERAAVIEAAEIASLAPNTLAEQTSAPRL